MNLKEKTLDSKRVYEGRVVNLRVDTVELPDGRKSTREIVEHMGAVAIVPLVDHTKVVMVKQFRQAAAEVLLEIPAGGMELDETAEQCAARELTEETGYAAGRIARMFSSYLAPGYSEEMLHTFLAEDLVVAKADLDDDEFVEVVTVDLDEAVGMIGTGEIKDAKSICGILMAQRVISSREG